MNNSIKCKLLAMHCEYLAACRHQHASEEHDLLKGPREVPTPSARDPARLIPVDQLG